MTREEAKAEINKVFEPAFANYIITALVDGATPSESRWIPVTERLPEENGFYLCSIKSYDSDNYVLFGRFSMGKFNLIDVDAWMPLPKPYEGSETNAVGNK